MSGSLLTQFLSLCTVHVHRYTWLWLSRGLGLLVGQAAMVITYGFGSATAEVWHAQELTVLSAALLAILPWLDAGQRLLLPPRESDPAADEDRHVRLALGGAWLLGALLIEAQASDWLLAWARGGLGLATAVAAASLSLRVSLSGLSPAAALVITFAALIATGTLLLMLPTATRDGHGAPPLTAAFTATSAVTVTGLNVEDAGVYWSRRGQAVILVLIQLGGLGLLTFGGMATLLTGRSLLVRETAILGDLFEQQGVLSSVRQLLISVLLFTVAVEAIGAVLLSELWADRPLAERVFLSVFHSVSAFNNAGFSAQPGGFENAPITWQIWGVICVLVILGGLGFSVHANLAWLVWVKLFPPRRQRGDHPPPERPRLELSNRLALVGTALLLALGWLGVLLLETADKGLPGSTGELGHRLADTWFVSVNCRTAGFNTTPIADYAEATRAWMILLMYVGASPGSTGGGVKTVAVLVTVMALAGVLRSRERVEIAHRTVPDLLVRKAMLIVILGAALAALAGLLLAAVEGDRAGFLNYQFESVSALSTVGLSAGVTPTLSGPGRLLVMALMFLGRIGPLTLMFAVAGRAANERYRYPEERVALG